MDSRRDKNPLHYKVFLIIFLLQSYNGVLLSEDDNQYGAKVQSSLGDAIETTDLNRLASAANTKDKSLDARTATIDEAYETFEIDLGPSRENALHRLKERNPSKIEDIFPKNQALSNTQFAHAFESSISDDFRLTISSIRSELLSSISSWSVSNFDYAGVPTAKAEFKDNVDYYFIDDANSTRPLNLKTVLTTIVNATAGTAQTSSSSTATFASQILPNKTQPTVISYTSITAIVTTTPIVHRSAVFDGTSVIDSSAISNDSMKAVTTNTTANKTQKYPIKDDDFNIGNEIKPSPTQRPVRGPRNDTNPSDGDSRMEYHHSNPSNDTVSLQSSMTSPTLVYVSLMPDVKRKSVNEDVNVTRLALHPEVSESSDSEDDAVRKTGVPHKEFTIENIPISSNLIKYTYDVPKIIEPKDPYTRYPDKVKPSRKDKSSTDGKLPALMTSSSLVTSLLITATDLQTKSMIFEPSTTIPASQATIAPHSNVHVSSRTEPPTIYDYKDTYPVLVNITLSSSWRDFCSNKAGYQSTLANIVRDETNKNVTRDQIKFLDIDTKCSQYKNDGNHRSARDTNNINILFLVEDEDGKYDRSMTLKVGKRLKSSMHDFVGKFGNKLLHVSLWAPSDEGENGRLTKTSLPDFSSTSIITGIVLSVIAAICLITLSVVLLVVKQKSAHSAATLPPNMMDGLNMDSFPGRGGSVRRKRGRLSLRSFLNQAFDEPEYPSHPLSFSNLTNAINNKILLEEEFKKLPITVPSLEEIPEGAEAKNRYANVIPNPETRVILSPLHNEDHSDYINANYVKGYGGKLKEYIATQAPLPETVNDFWRMVWEQQSRMILMLTQLDENGASRCAPYFPDNTHDCNRAYGDFQVSLQSKDVRENFVVSIFKLYEIERNLFREVIHLWYTAWPAHRVPEDHSSLLSFILETRNHVAHRSSGPLVVHCSPGTGRTGAVIAIDILMKEYEENRLVDVQRCVSRLKHERYGTVHNVQQYILIHEVLHDFIVKMGTQSQRPSLKSLMSLKLH